MEISCFLSRSTIRCPTHSSTLSLTHLLGSSPSPSLPQELLSPSAPVVVLPVAVVDSVLPVVAVDSVPAAVLPVAVVASVVAVVVVSVVAVVSPAAAAAVASLVEVVAAPPVVVVASVVAAIDRSNVLSLYGVLGDLGAFSGISFRLLVHPAQLQLHWLQAVEYHQSKMFLLFSFDFPIIAY